MTHLARTVLVLLALSPTVGATQRYVSFEPERLSLDDGPLAIPTITLHESGGRAIAAPWVADQTGFVSVKISPDHRRVGWITLKHNICCSEAIGLVIFEGGRIERNVDGCIANWKFANVGPVITYWTEPCHLASSAQFFMLDTASDFTIASYLFPYQDADGNYQDQLPDDAPQWVRDLYVMHD